MIDKDYEIAAAAQWLVGDWYVTYEPNEEFRIKHKDENGQETTIMEFSFCETAANFSAHFNPTKVKQMLDRIAGLEKEWTNLVEATKAEHELRVSLESQLDRAVEVIKFYANWKSWDWASVKTYDDTPLTNIREDTTLELYTENDGDKFENYFGGKRARIFLASLEEK